VHSDRAHAYGDRPLRQRQVCWAHLLRNLQGLLDQHHAESWWAQRMLEQARMLFAAWGWFRTGWFDRVALQQALIPVRTALRGLLEQGRTSAWIGVHAMSRRLLRVWDALWIFSQVEGIEPSRPPTFFPIHRSLQDDWLHNWLHGAKKKRPKVSPIAS
jgi:transposase